MSSKAPPPPPPPPPPPGRSKNGTLNTKTKDVVALTEVEKLTLDEHSLVLNAIAICLRAKSNDSSILFASKFKSGWEEWLQIELAIGLLRILSKDPAAARDGYSVERGNQVWTANGKGKFDGTGKCDIWIAPGPGFDRTKSRTSPGVDILELKAAYHDGERKELVRERMIADMSKVIYPLNVPTTEKTKGLVLRPICIGVTGYPEDLTGDWSSAPGGASSVKYMWIVRPDGAKSKGAEQDGLAMIWWEPKPGDMREKVTEGPAGIKGRLDLPTKL